MNLLRADKEILMDCTRPQQIRLKNALESLANRIERQSAVGRGEMVRTIRKAMKAFYEKEAVWEEYQNKWGQINFRCSNCKKYRFHNGAMIREYKYCPGCGAKMDLEDDE